MSTAIDDFVADLAGVDPVDFAARFTELFDASELSQSELARRTKLKQQSISGWLAGESTPRANIIPILAAALGCEPGDFFIAPKRRAKKRKDDDD